VVVGDVGGGGVVVGAVVAVGLVGGGVCAGDVGAGVEVLGGADDTAGRSAGLVVTGPVDEPDLKPVGADVVGSLGASVANKPGTVVDGSDAIGRRVSTWDVSARLVPEASTTAKATTTRVATTMPGRRSFHRAVHQSCNEASQAPGSPPRRSLGDAGSVGGHGEA